LLDDPADKPELGFHVYADALSQMIEHSRPQFAIGIFGDWGSGKTTLMRAIKAHVEQQTSALPVWFNAWRYEKEEHLIVPLLDHLREGLLAWEPAGAGGKTPKWAAESAGLFGRAARRILSGLTLEAGIPGAKAKVDFSRIIESPAADAGPASFYHAAFQDMDEATKAFAGGAADRRIVVFVDDLDRCLPVNALQVLESMKLFFDFEGFVFVVGLDRGVIERSIEAKYEGGSPSRAPVIIDRSPAENGAARAALALAPRGRGDRAAPISGAEYIKKVFQVPFALPRVGAGQVDELLSALRKSPKVPTVQADDLTSTVRPHIAYLTDRDSLNPREVKRLINAYTLQMKLLYPRLGPGTSADTVLAIQLMDFRDDWARINSVLLGDPDGFLTELRRLIEQRRQGSVEPAVLGDDAEPVPPEFIAYIRDIAGALLQQDSLVPYVSSAEQTRTTDPGSLDAQQAVRRLRRLLTSVADGQPLSDPSVLVSELSVISRTLERSADAAPDLYEPLVRATRSLEEEFSSLSRDPAMAEKQLPSWRQTVDGIYNSLAEIRRRAAVGIG
jgi:KAP family P-loop domain